MLNENDGISNGALSCAPPTPSASTQLVACREPGRQRHKRWPREERARIVAESFNTSRSVAQVARDNGVSDALLHYWRRQARKARSAEEVRFVPVRVSPEVQAAAAIEAVVCDVTVRIRGDVDVTLLQAVFEAARR